MSNSRIKEIDKQIAKLLSERSELEEIEKLPEIERKIKNYLSRTYSGVELLKHHNLDEKGLWNIKGEDPNCDMGGYHHQPELGIVDGTLNEALTYALKHPDFYSWGGGGNIQKIKTIKLNGK